MISIKHALWVGKLYEKNVNLVPFYLVQMLFGNE
jgi:hypothetical protein